MKNSEHSPEEQWSDNTSADNEENEPKVNNTPAPDTTPAASTASPSTPQQEPEHDTIQQGLVYPPPPSFYQQAQPDPAPLHSPQGSPNAVNAAEANNTQQTPQTHPMGQWGAPPPGYPRFPQGQSYPGLQPPPYFPGPPPVPPRPRQANGWITALWITLGLVIALSCGLCGWGGVSYISAFSGVTSSIGSSRGVINNYYDALQNQNYSLAYSYLQPQGTISGLSQDQFTQDAQQADTQNGHILRYTAGQLQPKAGTNGNMQFTDDVQIAREHKQYTAHLTLGMVNGTFKILSYDTL
jgi:hypothetical protein